MERALAVVLEHTHPLDSESIDFVAAPGRLLREDVVSDIDMPPFARSAVDGYALRARDVEQTPARLRIVGSVPAGTYPDFHIAPGDAASIMTGAPLPEGADAVQMVEQSRTIPEGHRGDAGGTVEIFEAVAAGQNVAPRGSEVRAGDVVLRRGSRLDAAAVAVAATVGKTKLLVGRRPVVAVAATGDELVDPGVTPGPGQIRNCNGFSLVAQCASVGIEPEYLGVARDDEASLDAIIRRGLGADVLLLSGGVSMGRFDLVEDVLAHFGVEILIDAVALKPGKPLVFGRSASGKLVFGLPGNPVSTMVTFELFVRPALARLEGAESSSRKTIAARLLGRLSSKGPRKAYLPGWVRTDEDGALLARPIPSRGSADIVAFSKANALLIVPEECNEIAEGETVRFHPLDSFLFKDDRWHAPRDES